MKQFRNFMFDNNIFEMSRPKGSKNKPKNVDNDENVVNAKDVDPKDITYADDGKEVTASKAKSVMKAGVSAENNGSKGKYAYEAPTEEEMESWATIKADTRNNTNARFLASCFKSKQDFFIQGEAGWGKTDLITNIAHRAGYNVLTVYLDKAAAVDLGGIPVPVEDEETNTRYAENTLPLWAQTMLMNKDKKFLLFFDEMNQAQPDVMNALMPIVLKHEICNVVFDNIIVGAAGNFDHENEGVNDLSKPLRSRFRTYTWDVRSDEAWEGHFAWAHKHFDDKLGAEFIDKVKEFSEYLSNPRQLTNYLYKYCIENADGTLDDVKDIRREIESKLVYENLSEDKRESRKFKDSMDKFAEFIFNWCEAEDKDSVFGDTRSSRKKSKGTDQVYTDDAKKILECLKNGWFYNDDSEAGPVGRYACTLENVIVDLFNPEITGVTAEVLHKLIKQKEAEGNWSIKYKTNKDAEQDAKSNNWHTIVTIDGKEYLDGDEVEIGFMSADHLSDINVNGPSSSKRKKVSHSND